MAKSRSSQACSVPYCSNSKKKQPYLSFHAFPTDDDLRRRWILSIRRQEGVGFTVKRGSTFVCALHFKEEEVLAHIESGRKFLKPQAVPSRFHWNNRGENNPSHTKMYTRSGSNMEETTGNEMECDPVAVLAQEHNYACRPPGALEKIKELDDRVLSLTLSGTLLDRWCVSDEDFRYFTGFPSKHVFLAFWRSVEPSASRIGYWSEASRIGVATVKNEVIRPSPRQKLQLIDEFYMFCLRVAAGLKERVLAGKFGVSTDTVSCALITWSNYLYLVLGSVQIWMTREQVRRTMPVKFQQVTPNLRVIVDCTEFRRKNPKALTLHCETFSTHKSYTTFKALIGVAPSGAITFASKVFTGPISVKELARQSGILELLEPGDEIMADKDFFFEKALVAVGAKLITPPIKHKSQLSREETTRTQATARLHILIEQAIRRIKEYRIWDSPVPLTLAGTVNQIWSCCCMMANYQGPLNLEETSSTNVSDD